MKSVFFVVLPSVFVLLLGCVDSESRETFRFNEAIDNVRVDVSLGQVTVVGDPSLSDAQVVVTLWCRTVVPEYDVYVAGGALIVELEAGMDASGCDGTFEIRLPAEVDVIAKSKAGDISVSGIEGRVNIVSFDGDVSLLKVAGDINVAVVSGDFDGTALTGDSGKVTVGAGAVNLTYAGTPSTIDVDIIMGHAHLVVPAHVYYSVDVRTEHGKMDISDDILIAAAAKNTLKLSVDSGDITLLGI